MDAGAQLSADKGVLNPLETYTSTVEAAGKIGAEAQNAVNCIKTEAQNAIKCIQTGAEQTQNLVTTGHFVTDDKLDNYLVMDAYAAKKAGGDNITASDTLAYFESKEATGQKLTDEEATTRALATRTVTDEKAQEVRDEFHNGTGASYLEKLNELAALDPSAAQTVKSRLMNEYASDLAAQEVASKVPDASDTDVPQQSFGDKAIEWGSRYLEVVAVNISRATLGDISAERAAEVCPIDAPKNDNERSADFWGNSILTSLTLSVLPAKAGKVFGPVTEEVAVETSSRISSGIMDFDLQLFASETKLKTVGRWMSKDEYEIMKTTGHVPESLSGTTHVASPANIEAFQKQAPKDSVYVEFDVPSGSVKQTSDIWGKIVGPNSLEGRLASKKGLEIPQMPAAENIVIKGRK